MDQALSDSEARPQGGLVEPLIARGRAAMAAISGAAQDRTDEMVIALAWSLYRPDRAAALAKLAVKDTGLGNVGDKIIKNQRKTFGTLRDLLRAKTVGVIEQNRSLGIIRFAKPVGIVAAVTPSTNPSATAVNIAMMAIKGRNAIIVAPSPSGFTTTSATVEAMRSELQRIGAPADLVQVLPPPASKDATEALMQAADLVVVTGSQDNVRRAYRSGTPAIGVGAGNVPVIIDETAELEDAARKIAASKTFDNATSCSSENAVVLVESIHDEALAALGRAGGYLCTADEARRARAALWQGGKLNRSLIAKDAAVLATAFGLSEAAHGARFFMVEESGTGPAHPFSGEKLSLVLAVYRAADFEAAAETVRQILDYQGRGHSCGIHTRDAERPGRLAERLDVVRVLVNFAHTFGNGGGFDSGLNFTLSMGCGTWQKNSISENLSYRHFLNITHLVRPIPEDRPSEEELFGQYWAKFGR
ncbi:MAG: acylating sulfoacetaldehyde dehydrogenase [Acetobacteraceae bacterium]